MGFGSRGSKSSLDNNIVIGPSNAGKTALLSALELAATSVAENGLGKRIIVRPTTQATIDLFNEARRTIVAGRLPINASASTVEHGFEVLSRTVVSGMLDRLAAVFPERPIGTFSMLDGPGGALFETRVSTDSDVEIDQRALEQGRQELIQRIRRASGMVICLDATSGDSVTQFFIDLPKLLAEVGERPLKLRRVVIALTKADQVTAEQNNNARDALSNVCPVERVNSLLGRPVLRTLDAYLDRRAELACCWTSIFGFAKRGYANYDNKTGGLLVRPDPQSGVVSASEAIDNWRPYQVLSPFDFLARGRAPGIKKVPR